MPTIIGILIFTSLINTSFDNFKGRTILIFQHFSFILVVEIPCSVELSMKPRGQATPQEDKITTIRPTCDCLHLSYMCESQRFQHFDPNHHLHVNPIFVYGSSQCSGESARMRMVPRYHVLALHLITERFNTIQSSRRFAIEDIFKMCCCFTMDKIMLAI